MADTNTNKFLDYAGLSLYDQKIKNYIDTHDEVGYDTVKADNTTALTKRNTLKFAKGDNITITGSDVNNESVITISALDEKTTKAGHYTPSGGTNKVTNGGNAKTINSVTIDEKGHITAIDTTDIAFPITGVSKDNSVENYVQLSVVDTTGDVKISINDNALHTAITSIQGLIAGGVHFRGVVSQLPASPFTGYTNGDIVIVGNKEYILNKPENTTGEWVELGDTTAELNRITAIEAGYIQTAENGTGTEVVLTDGTNPIDGVTDKKLKVNLKVATGNELGGIKIGYTENGKNYPVELDSNNKAFVNVPWVDNDTKVTSVDNHYKGTISTNPEETDVYSNTQIEVVNGIEYDAAGHVTSYNTVTMNFHRVTDAEINALFA